MNNVSKLLTASLFIANFVLGTNVGISADVTKCVKPVQFTGKLSISAGKSKGKIECSREKLKDVFKQWKIDPTARFTPASKDNLGKKLTDSGVVTTNVEKGAVEMKNIDIDQDGNNTLSLFGNEAGGNDFSSVIKIGQNISVENRDPSNVRISFTENFIANNDVLRTDLNTPLSEGKMPENAEITQVLKFAPVIDTSKLPDNLYEKSSDPVYDLYEKWNSFNSLTGAGWQLSGEASVGVLFNSPCGGGLELSLSGEWFFNQVIDCIFTDSENSTSTTSGDKHSLKLKYGFGFYTGGRIYLFDNFFICFGGGIKSYRGSFFPTNGDDSQKSDSSSSSSNTKSFNEKFDLKGCGFFGRIGLGFDITKNFALGIGLDYYPNITLKSVDSTSDSTNNSNSSSATTSPNAPVNITWSRGPVLSINCMVRF